MLSNKELEFVRKSLSGASLNVDTILDMINRKRPATEKLTVKDLHSAIKSQQEENNKTNQDAPQTITENKSNKSLAKLGKSIQLEGISETVKGVLDEVGPTIGKLISSPLPEDYVILSSKTQGGLTQEVLKYMSIGWVPLGGVSAAAFGVSPIAGNQYIQAMVKY